MKEGISITGNGTAGEKAPRLRRIGPITEKERDQGSRITVSKRKGPKALSVMVNIWGFNLKELENS